MALCFEPPASAAPVTIAFEGVISTQGSFIDGSGTFAPGDAISGFWTFESATPDGDLAPSRGEYVQSGAPAFQIDIAAHTFVANAATVQILDDHLLGIGTIDAYDVLSAQVSSTLPGLVVSQMQITLRDTAAPLDAVTSDLLPLAAPDPATFDQQGQAAGQITGFFPDGQLFMNLEIRSTRVVPEPGSWLTAGLGLACLCLVRFANGEVAAVRSPQRRSVVGNQQRRQNRRQGQSRLALTMAHTYGLGGNRRRLASPTRTLFPGNRRA